MAAFHVIATSRSFNQTTAAKIIESFREGHRHLQFDDLDHGGAKFYVTGDDTAATAFIAHVKQYLGQEEDEIESTVEITYEEPSVSSLPSKPVDIEAESGGAQYCLWTPDPANADYRFHDSLLQEVSRLTGCSIQPTDGTSFGIRGENFDCVKATMGKLDVISTAGNTTTPLFNDSLRGNTTSKRLVFRSVAELQQTEKLGRGMLAEGRSLNVVSQMLLILPMELDGQIQSYLGSKRVLGFHDLWEGHDWRPVNLMPQDSKVVIEVWLSETTPEPTQSHRPDYEVEPPASTTQTTRRVRQVQRAKMTQLPESTQSLKSTQPGYPKTPNPQSAQQPQSYSQGIGQQSQSMTECEATHVFTSASMSHMTLSDLTNLRSGSLLDDATFEQRRLPERFSLLAPSKFIPLDEQYLPSIEHEDLNHETKRIVVLLRLAQAHPSPARLQIILGRLLVHPDSVSKRMRSRPIPHSTWGGSRGMKSFFMARLTNVQAEAESILDIKLRRGRNAFVVDPRGRVARFELLCRIESGEEVCVDISDEGASTVRPVRKIVGGINLYHPKNRWDARMTVDTSMFLLGDYASQATDISKSFKVRPMGMDTAVVSLRSMDPGLKILQGRAIRETFHSSVVYPDLVLKLTEYRDMQLQAQVTDFTFYEGQIRTCAELAPSGMVWWEASLSSLKADTLMASRSQQELGELATWTSEEVASNDTIGSMLTLADDMVLRMNHIGNTC